MKKREDIETGKMSGSEEIRSDPEDNLLFGEAGDYLKGYLDIEDVKNDPLYTSVAEETREVVARFNNNDPKHTENAKFIRGSLSEEKRNVDKITAEWVKEWKEKQDKNDPATVERRDFIVSALRSDDKVSAKDTSADAGNLPARTVFARYLLPVAALLAGAFFIIRILLPPADPGKIYLDFYSPVNAMTSVTRSISNDLSGSYSSAIESYKNKDYLSASAGFTVLLQNDPTFIPARFFLGVIQMELGNFDEAVQYLSSVAGTQNDFSVDAAWYLGLSFLKKGDKISAEKYFSGLAGSKSFYNERAEKILRRLK